MCGTEREPDFIGRGILQLERTERIQQHATKSGYEQCSDEHERSLYSSSNFGRGLYGDDDGECEHLSLAGSDGISQFTDMSE